MQHFTIQELSASASAERLAIDNTPPRAAQRMLTILVKQLLDPIRRRYGAPIIVTSGYRCPALNTAVGGVANSHHIVGCAADITTGSVENNTMLFALIIDMQTTHAIRFTQLIAEKDYRWLHISYVPGMLRNQIINVNVDDNDDDNHQPEGKRCEAQSTSALTLSLEETSTLKRDYQDSG